VTDAADEDAVVVTGLGAVSALGTGVEAHRAAMWAGRDGFRAVERFDTSRLSAHLAATWPGWDGRTQPEPGPDRDLAATAADFPLHELALIAAREAWCDAGVAGVDPRRTALIFGTCFGHGFSEFDAVADRIAAGLELAGPRVTISTACSSSTNAIGLARDLLLRGYADTVLAGGADALLREAFAGFSALGVLTAERCAPFSEPPGTTLGEGAGFVVVERSRDASRRGARRWASIHGYGLSADGFHETTPDPTGDGLARAIRSALADARWGADSVDFVSAHATGTTNNDRIEWSVIERELGARSGPPLVSSSKSQIGHTQGAAGVLEFILALVCQREGVVPSTLHFRGPRPGCPSDPTADCRPRVHAVARALKLSAAFGGANAVLAYGPPGTGPVKRPVVRSRVAVRGVGVVGPAGAFRAPSVLELTSKRVVGTCGPVDLGRIGVDPRRLDRSAQWLTAAAGLALGEEGRALRGQATARTGLFVGATRMPEESSRRCREAIRQHGVAGTSASAFARMSVNAPAGACSRALGLLGPTTTVSIGEGSGLLALVLAVEWLTQRDDADGIVAGGVDEWRGGSRDEAEGASCLLLGRAEAQGSAIVAAGWGIAGRGDVREATRQALGGRADVDGVLADGEPRDLVALTQRIAPNARLGFVDVSRFWATSEATRSCTMAALAVAHLLGGCAGWVLVIATRGASSVALLLEREGK
jgi:3-oxoacyl-[acyl-carrier-protein] synthase II